MTFDQTFALHYQQFPAQLVFAPEKIIPYGITEETYDEIRRGYAAVRAGLNAGAWYRSGCLPILFFISIVGIPLFLFYQWSEGVMWQRARNAAILAFRAAASKDPDYMRYFSNLFAVTGQSFDSVF